VKLLRTIRLDPSDALVFQPAAEPGEWAVVGGFLFWDQDPATLTGKDRVAFRSGLLGIESFGWSTLVAVADAKAADWDAALCRLADQLEQRLGAPTRAAAEAAAEEELRYAETLADHPTNTLIAVHRSLNEAGEIVEQFRTLSPRAPGTRSDMARFGPAFTIVPSDEETVAEAVDLMQVMQGPKP
jgi:hypothetical protein